MIDSLRGDEAQAFVDVVHDVRHPFFLLAWHDLISFFIPVPLILNFYLLSARLWTSQTCPHLSGGSV
jgi:hypothetical protein